MMQWIRRFMYGRYGTDALNRFLSVVALVLMVVSVIVGWTPIYLLAVAIVAFSLFRSFSRNTWKRQRENQVYLQAFSRIKTRHRQRKTHCFFTCKSCRTTLRVPKGRGRMIITCPKCKNKFEGRT